MSDCGGVPDPTVGCGDLPPFRGGRLDELREASRAEPLLARETTLRGVTWIPAPELVLQSQARIFS